MWAVNEGLQPPADTTAFVVRVRARRLGLSSRDRIPAPTNVFACAVHREKIRAAYLRQGSAESWTTTSAYVYQLPLQLRNQRVCACRRTWFTTFVTCRVSFLSMWLAPVVHPHLHSHRSVGGVQTTAHGDTEARMVLTPREYPRIRKYRGIVGRRLRQDTTESGAHEGTNGPRRWW